MAKKAVSVTLDSDNVLWLKGRARIAGSTVSDTIDKIVTQARTLGRFQTGRYPSVVGMVDLSRDPDLSKWETMKQRLFDESHGAFAVREEPPRPRSTRRKKPRG